MGQISTLVGGVKRKFADGDKKIPGQFAPAGEFTTVVKTTYPREYLGSRGRGERP
jgi:hypothetical protein